MRCGKTVVDTVIDTSIDRIRLRTLFVAILLVLTMILVGSSFSFAGEQGDLEITHETLPETIIEDPFNGTQPE